MLRHPASLAILLFLCACTARQQQTGSGALPVSALRAGPCADGVGSSDRNAPIVCVDDRGARLSVTPDPIRMHDVRASDRAPVVIHWHTVSGTNDLQIEIEPGCITDMRCDSTGHCFARSMPREDKSEKRCKYDVWTDRHPRLDPDVIVTPCC